MMVNIQDVQEFACQTLNRDVWANAAVKELVKSYFVLWQVGIPHIARGGRQMHHDSGDGQRICSYYRVSAFPAIFIVDPRTGEMLTTLRGQDAVSFCDQGLGSVD